jgi:hypothetical protein
VFGQEDKFVDLAHVPPHLEGALLLLIDTYSFVPTLLELLLAYHYGGTTGLYISYVGGALCKAGSLWFNVTNHPPEQPTDSRGCAAVDDVDKGKLEPPNIFFALVQVSRSPPRGPTNSLGPMLSQSSLPFGRFSLRTLFSLCVLAPVAYQPSSSRCSSQECTWPYTFLIGEAVHDHHHVFPALAHRPGGVDLPYFCFILPLEKLGLIWNVKHLQAHQRWEAGAGKGGGKRE